MSKHEDGQQIEVDPARELVGWIGNITVETGETGPLVLVERRGNLVIARLADPCDGEVPRLPIYEDDKLVVKTPISFISLNETGEVGRVDDYLTGMRIVPDRQEGNIVYGRSLRRGEIDNGARIHVWPEDELRFEPGSIILELEAIDDTERLGKTGYVPITPVLWTWFRAGTHDDTKVRYLLAAARRLDAAALRLAEIEKMRSELHDQMEQPLVLRRTLFKLIGNVESAVIALGRACDMIVKAGDLLVSCNVAAPSSIASRHVALTDIRNAYEHIEDRALGQVKERPHPDALTVFDQSELLAHDRITYALHSLDLKQDVPPMLADGREFLKKAASNA